MGRMHGIPPKRMISVVSLKMEQEERGGSAKRLLQFLWSSIGYYLLWVIQVFLSVTTEVVESGVSSL